MRLPAWPRRLLPRRKQRPDAARQRLMDPVRLSFRRLEGRRVLDVSAAFMSATGILNLQLSGDAETATISAQDGKLVVTKANQDVVEIQDENSMPTSVGLSELRFLGVTGDAAADQSVHINVALAPFDGVLIDSSIETVVINRDITRVSNGDVNLNEIGRASCRERV